MKLLKILRPLEALLFCTFFCYSFFALTTTASAQSPPDTAFYQLSDATGYADQLQAHHLDSLNAAALSLREALPQEFQSDFGVYDLGFYHHHTAYEGGIPDVITKAIANRVTHPYYLLFGRELDNEGKLKKVWVEMELPEGGYFSCVETSTFNFTNSIILKLTVQIGNPVQLSNQMLYSGIIRAISTFEELLYELSICCDLGFRSLSSCNFCIFTEQEFYSILELTEFNFHPIQILSKDSLNLNPNHFGVEILINNQTFDLDNELNTLDSIIGIFDSELSLKIFAIDYDKNCENFPEVIEDFHSIATNEIGIMIIIYSITDYEGLLGWKMVSYDEDFLPLEYLSSRDITSRSFNSNDSCYFFDTSNNFIYSEQCNKETLPLGIIHNYMGFHFNLEFIFSDPIITPQTLVAMDDTRNPSGGFLMFGNTKEPLINKVYSLSKDDIHARLSQVIKSNQGNPTLGAFDYHGVFIGPILSLYTGSDGFNAPFDFSTKDWFLNRQNFLFLTSLSDVTVGHNFRNMGNFLWGATTYIMGVPEVVAIGGAHIYALKNEGEFDSPDDIFAIKLGRQYAREVGFRTIYGGKKNIFKR